MISKTEQQERIRMLENTLSKNMLARMVVELEEKTITDPLTGIRSRRYLIECAHELFAKSLNRSTNERRRKGTQPISVLFVDIDHFKHVNDTYGHRAGDAVLQQVAVALEKGIREDDIVARYGGEEFAVLMPGASESIAASRATKLLKKIKDLSFEKHPEITITVSIGVAVSEQFTSFDELCDAADKALYHAKDNGRNQVICHSVIDEKRRWTAGTEYKKKDRRKR